MKKAFVILFMILSHPLLKAQNHQKLDSIVSQKIQQLTNGREWMKFSAGIIYAGRPYTYQYHTSDETIYEIASITKTFSSLILAHAIMEGKVKATDDIRKYLAGDFSNLEYKGHPIQLIQLVNLTSSLPDNFPAKSDFILQLHQAKLDTIPGLVPRHSNVAAILLGQLLENIYHKPYTDLLKKYITDPLHMDHTFFDIPTEQLSHFPKGYNWKGTVMPYIPKESGTAGGLHSSISDMMKYLQYHLDEKDPAVQMTHQPQWGNINEFGIGMNWFLGKTGDGKRLVRDDGTTYGFTTYFLLYPDSHFGIVLMSNERDSVSSNKLGDMSGDIFNEMYYTAAERASLAFGFSPSVNQFLSSLEKKGFDHATEVFDDLKSKDSGFYISENDLNNWGYSLLSRGKKQESLEIFKLNVHLHPDSWNVYDSYGETLLAMGQNQEAIKMYRKSVELNPGNENGKKVLSANPR